jgi:hypothetical protein
MTINDPNQVLSPGDIAAINSAASAWPFTANVTIGQYPHRADFEHAVSAAVTGPRVVSIGLDTGHHFVSVHFGNGLNIPRERWDAISSMGKANFRAQHWGAGIVQIGDQAKASIETNSSVAVPPPSRDHTLLWVGCGLGLLALVLVVWAVMRKRRDDRFAYSPAAAYPGSVPPSGGYGSYSSPPMHYSSGPTVIHSGGNDGLLTGVLIGNMLSEHPRAEVAEHVSSSDHGSSSSTYGSDSGGGYDSGSSGSSWDSGSSGGFDSGGGGFDSGGGGGDW